eukprot:7383521-Pyramimonas_sp.AAC.1
MCIRDSYSYYTSYFYECCRFPFFSRIERSELGLALELGARGHAWRRRHGPAGACATRVVPARLSLGYPGFGQQQ